jgi:hypothetical protein
MSFLIRVYHEPEGIDNYHTHNGFAKGVGPDLEVTGSEGEYRAQQTTYGEGSFTFDGQMAGGTISGRRGMGGPIATQGPYVDFQIGRVLYKIRMNTAVTVPRIVAQVATQSGTNVTEI